MIITRTPYRISFAGGGSDLPAFYSEEPGMVVSAAIDKYVYITLDSHYDGQIRASYSCTENVAHVSELQHSLIRESLSLVGVRRGVEITCHGNIPSGTGLGSSSSFTVGLLAALAAYQGCYVGAEQLAHDACRVEIERCKQPIGKQDQYAAAYGGLRAYTFHPDGRVGVEALAVGREVRAQLEQHLLLLDTGRRRDAGAILGDVSAAMRDSRRRATVRSMANLAATFRQALLVGDLRECGDILDAAWRLKRNVASGVTDDPIDAAYSAALKAGAWGGKVCGAGGGGFLLFLAPRDRHAAIVAACGLRAVDVRLSDAGATVIYSSGGA